MLALEKDGTIYRIVKLVLALQRLSDECSHKNKRDLINRCLNTEIPMLDSVFLTR